VEKINQNRESAVSKRDIKYTATQLDIIYAAELAMGQKGIKNASHRDVIRYSRQKNISAINYHFKSMDGVIDAILNIRMDVIDSERSKLIKEVEKNKIITNLDLVSAYIDPLYKKIFYDSGWSNYIFFLNDLISMRNNKEISKIRNYNLASNILEKKIAKLNNIPIDAMYNERVRTNARFFISSFVSRKREINNENSDIIPEKDYINLIKKTSIYILTQQ